MGSSGARRLLGVLIAVAAASITACAGQGESPPAGSAEAVAGGAERLRSVASFEGYERYAGDILLDRADPNHRRLIQLLVPGAGGPSVESATQVGIGLWPSGQVRYHFAANVPEDHRTRIRDAMRGISAVSNATYLEQGAAGFFVYEISLVDNPAIGGESTLGLTTFPIYHYTINGLDQGTITHELLHGLGFVHEHQRYNRDEFVTINTANVDPAFRDQFSKQPWNLYVPFSTYDYESIMHYPAWAFSANGQVTIDGHGHTIGQRNALSAGDVAGLRARYGSFSQGPSALAFLHGSVNADRQMDLIQVWDNGGRAGLITYVSNGSAGFTNAWGSGSLGPGAGALAWLPGDVNGDGRTDVIQVWNDGGYTGLITYLSDGTGYYNNWGAGRSIGPGAGALGWLTGDVNGDGRTDIIQPWKSGSRLGLITYLSDGNGYYNNWGSADMGNGPGAQAFLTGDVNGDGRTDVIQVWNDGGYAGLITYLSNGNGYYNNWGAGRALGPGVGALAWLTGDVNGDGRTDVIQPFDNGGRLGLITYLSDGNGYYNNFGNGDMGQGSGALAWLTGDVNGDGRTDLVQAWDNAGKLGLITYLSDGNGYYAAWGTGDIGMPTGASSWHLGDVDGDGRADVTITFDANGRLGVKTFFSTGAGFRNL